MGTTPVTELLGELTDWGVQNGGGHFDIVTPSSGHVNQYFLATKGRTLKPNINTKFVQTIPTLKIVCPW